MRHMANIHSIADLNPDPHNRRVHNSRNIGMIRQALGEVGAARSIVIDEDGTVLAGNGVLEAAADAGIERVQVVDADGEMIIAVRRTGLSDEQKRKLALYDNRTAELATWDASQLVADLEAGFDFDGLFTTEELLPILADAANELLADERDAKQDGQEDTEPEIDRADVPDALWPTDNEWGVPLLDVTMQALALDMPVVKWGTVARTSKMRGTWHFYTDDYKFTALWSDPSPVGNSQCVNVIEPNFSTGPDTPRAVVLWLTYQKRWLSRFWQSCGVRVFVDLNVEPCFEDINMLGIPQGWKAYATRWLDKYGVEDVIEQYRLAQERAGVDNPLFVVIGGYDKAQAACQAQGWIWIKEHAGAVQDRKLEAESNG